MIRIYRRGGLEILLVAGSAGLVIALPIETGMLLAIVLSFVHSLYIVARPYCVELARVPGSTVWWPPSASGQGEHEAGVLVFAPAAPLNFTNAEHICGKIKTTIAAQCPPVRLLVIEANGIIDIDYTGSQNSTTGHHRTRGEEYRRRHCPAVGRAGAGPGPPDGLDRDDWPRPYFHVGRGGGAQAGSARREPCRRLIARPAHSSNRICATATMICIHGGGAISWPTVLFCAPRARPQSRYAVRARMNYVSPPTRRGDR